MPCYSMCIGHEKAGEQDSQHAKWEGKREGQGRVRGHQEILIKWHRLRIILADPNEGDVTDKQGSGRKTETQNQVNAKKTCFCSSCSAQGLVCVERVESLASNPNSGALWQRRALLINGVERTPARDWRIPLRFPALYEWGWGASPKPETLSSLRIVPWHSPQSRSCRNSAGLPELCVLYRVEHSSPRTQNRPCMQNTALRRTCAPAARGTFQFPSGI